MEMGSSGGWRDGLVHARVRLGAALHSPDRVCRAPPSCPRATVPPDRSSEPLEAARPGPGARRFWTGCHAGDASPRPTALVLEQEAHVRVASSAHPHPAHQVRHMQPQPRGHVRAVRAFGREPRAGGRRGSVTVRAFEGSRARVQLPTIRRSTDVSRPPARAMRVW